MTVITADQMQDRLVSMSDLETMLGATEPISSEIINDNTRVRFRLQPGFETDLDTAAPSDVADAFITIGGGEEHPLTAEGILSATSLVGLSQAFVKRYPSHLIEPILNYWWNDNKGGKDYNALVVQDNVSAFTRSTKVPFSNLDLLERAVSKIEERHPGVQVFADYKINHSLEKTDIRLILPDIQKAISETYMLDIPRNEEDVWLGGIHLTNSLVAKGQTAFEPYLFRWWCTNGCTTEKQIGHSWSRQGSDGQNADEVMAWAERSVEEILGSFDAEFTRIQALTKLDVASNSADVLHEIFARYDIPVSQREPIVENALMNSDRLSMYTLMQAITQEANNVELSPDRADRLMRVGGFIPGSELDPLKARIYREGQTNPQGPNPYAVTVRS